MGRRSAVHTPDTIGDAPPRAALISARKSLGLTRPELAKALGVSRVTLYRIETGSRHPGLALMQRWAGVLGQPMEIFRAPPDQVRARPSRRAPEKRVA